MLNIAKTLLGCYGKFQILADALDIRIENEALHSYRGTGSVAHTLQQVEHITDMMTIKSQLVDLAVIYRAAMAKLMDKDRLALKLRYEEKLSYLEIAAKIGCSERTARRLVVAAIDSFAKKLPYVGLELEEFEKEFCKQEWIKKIYEANCDRN